MCAPMRVAASALAMVAFGAGAHAQPRDLPNGAGVVTGFSGVMLGAAPGEFVLDPDGKVARVLDLSSPGYNANGSRWDNVPEVLHVLARDAGQLFGIAVDNAQPANIYVTASSAYGLFRNPDNSDWMDGMWGPNGGPGTVYRLSAENAYQPEVFADLTVDDRPNSGAGLGNIAFDETNNQLFVSDLESGMIFRIDAASGQVIDRYDHGVDGRAYYLDSETAQYAVSDVVSFDPASAPRIADCGVGSADEAAARFSADPQCWNIADFRRRVYGLGIHEDFEIGAVRLYYAVWGSQSFGNPEWEADSDDATNTIWSVGLDPAGGFDLQSVRREFELPPFFVTAEDVDEHGASHPVTDIAFSSADAMFLAERGGLNGVSLPGDDAATTPRGSRVLLFSRGEEGLWLADGRFDVGYDERSDLDPPHLRAAAAGGLALGFGYTGSGALDSTAPEAVVWMTGDDLCSSLTPCPSTDGQGTDPRPTTGMQGTPSTQLADLAQPQAYAPYPSPGPVTPPTGPDASYMVGLQHTAAQLSPGHVGDFEIYRAAGEQPLIADVPDLAVSKRVVANCGPNELCRFQFTVLNAGTIPFEGPIVLSDDIGGGLVYRAGDHGEWICSDSGAQIACYFPLARLAPGERLSLSVDFLAPSDIALTRVRNCVAIEWLSLGGRDQLRAIQIELDIRGFDPGPPDGIVGPRTSAAIAEAERAFGLPETGEISDDLLIALFGPGGARDGDANPRNNSDCIYVDIEIPPPPAHQVQISAFHRRFASRLHDFRTSAPIELHDPAISSFHLRYRSSLHDGVTTRPIPLHRTSISAFHRTYRSDEHDPRTTRELPLHHPIISIFHRTLTSSLHNPVTSLRLPIHNPALSGFHRTRRSSEHDPRTTRERPTHNPVFSIFHRTRRSDQHDPRTTRELPLHNTILSTLHRTISSALHDPATTRARPLHQVTISNFHRTRRSDQHDPRTTRELPVHSPILSTFHRTQGSALHDPRTTHPLVIHSDVLSNFHRSNQSSLHVSATSRARPAVTPTPTPTPVHSPILSTFHRTQGSALHDPRTTHPLVIHSDVLSNFHRSNQSSQHVSATSRARPAVTPTPTPTPTPVHNPLLSGFHRSNQSSQHDSRTTRARPALTPTPIPTPTPTHNSALSTFHRSNQSSQHNSATSHARPAVTPRPTPTPTHNSALSTFHRSNHSSQHNSATSRATLADQPPLIRVPQPNVGPRIPEK
ncbi:MAG: peptidoglycan-binding domain-containing protein [Hyphomicrobiales bacterium]|nr:peptidoglycan-binding domain-containing protein [Hyphomicrobiales bacterium]